VKRIKVIPSLAEIPACFHPLFDGAAVYDSSCSPEARVLYIEKSGGLFLKSAPQGSLATEAEMNRFFFSRGMGPEVLAYHTEGRDWLLTARLAGEDATHFDGTPAQLADTLATLLRSLHESDTEGCPVKNRTAAYLATVEEGYRIGRFDPSYAPVPMTAEEAYRTVEEGKSALKTDCLLHGDYCLPNIIFENGVFRGFIDLGNGGVGDRHIDIFWGAWTLNFNLKTDRYRDRFLDAYGRDAIDTNILHLIGAAETFG